MSTYSHIGRLKKHTPPHGSTAPPLPSSSAKTQQTNFTHKIRSIAFDGDGIQIANFIKRYVIALLMIDARKRQTT
jgi:hypothetical protein